MSPAVQSMLEAREAAHVAAGAARTSTVQRRIYAEIVVKTSRSTATSASQNVTYRITFATVDPLPSSISACRNLATIFSALCRCFIEESFPTHYWWDSLTRTGSSFGKGVTKRTILNGRDES